MSNAYPTHKHFPPSPDHPVFSALVSIAETLQEAAQSLLRLTPLKQQDDSPLDEPKKSAQQGELRSYRVPFHILNDEQELLDEYGTDRIAHVLREIYTEFFLMLELMKGYAERKDDEDFTYFLVAEKLLKSLERLSKAHSVLVDFELQAKEPLVEA